MRFLIELMHVAIGIVAALVIAFLTAWALPQAKATIWIIDYVSIAFILGMGYLPLREAWAADRVAQRAAGGAAEQVEPGQ